MGYKRILLKRASFPGPEAALTTDFHCITSDKTTNLPFSSSTFFHCLSKCDHLRSLALSIHMFGSLDAIPHSERDPHVLSCLEEIKFRYCIDVAVFSAFQAMGYVTVPALKRVDCDIGTPVTGAFFNLPENFKVRKNAFATFKTRNSELHS